MVQICVDRYMMYLHCYMNSGNYRFKKCMDTISSVLEIYINEIYSATCDFGLTQATCEANRSKNQ